MKKVLFAIAAVAMLFATSCKKDNNAPENIQLGEGEFLATIDNGANPQNAPRVSDGMSTKTHIDANNYVIWDDGDVIYINGESYATKTGTTTAVFAPVEAAAAGSAFHAFYAVENPSATAATAQLPATQTYTPGRVSNLPMYATCGSDRLLTFQNICAALKITVPVACDHIVVSATENICGGFEMNGNAAVLNSNYGTLGNSVNVVRSADSFAKDEVIYAAIPAGTYTNFTISCKNAQDQMVLAKVVESITVAANNVYNVTLDINAPAYDCFSFKAGSGGATISMGASGSAPEVNLEYCTYTLATSAYTKWKTFTVGTTSVTLATNDVAYFRAAADGNNSFKGLHFEGSGILSVSGNIMYLLSQTPATTLDNSNNGNAFEGLFKNMTTLTEALGLKLPENTTISCYSEMFSGCSELQSAPNLPATSLSDRCYQSMFEGCSKLKLAPNLPATSLSEYCYAKMFNGCTALKNASQGELILPASILTEGCYNHMFDGCSILSQVIILATDGLNNANTALENWLPSSEDDPDLYTANDDMADWFNTGDGKNYGSDLGWNPSSYE